MVEQPSAATRTAGLPDAYDVIGSTYSAIRRPDPRIAALINETLGAARTVLNVGAGTGSYEPIDRIVVAVEPSATMIRQRPPKSAPAAWAIAERLPFATVSFDAVLAIFTVHHWSDWVAGLRELRRVGAQQVVMTMDPSVYRTHWLYRDYVPDVGAFQRRRVPSVEAIAAQLDQPRVVPIPIPHDCTDGFAAANWRRPEAFSDPAVVAADSGLAQGDAHLVEAGLQQLAADLATGRWHEHNAELLDLDELDIGVRLVVGGT